MQVRDGMSSMVLTVGPSHTLRQAAKAMSQRRVGAAVVVDPEASGLGILTERDILLAIGDGQDPDAEMVSDHLTSELVFAAPDWSLEQGAAAMVRGGFRHLIVIDEGEAAGVLSVRDREVLRLRFGEDLTQTEISKRVGVSQMQVSRIIRQALVRLRSDIDRKSERIDAA